MKTLLLSILICMFHQLSAQLSHFDSIQASNNRLDQMIDSIISNYENNAADFIILRHYDSLYSFNNQCRMVYKLDSCSHQFVLALDWDDLSVENIYVKNVEQRFRNAKECFDEFRELEKILNLSDAPTQLSKIDLPPFSEHRYTVYGKIKQNYFLFAFEEEFINEFHSGFVYELVCHHMGLRCNK